MSVSKKIKLDVNVLLDWIYDDNNIKNEDYYIISDLNNGTRSYVSSKPLNNIDNNLMTIDSVLKRYSKIDLTKNYIQKQSYTGNYIPFDKLKIYFPIDFNFTNYVGFNLKIYSLDYSNNNIYNICNYFYDKSLDSTLGTLDLVTPFNYDEKTWGKLITVEIPSIFNIAKDRIVSNTQNTAIPNSINYNLTNSVGLSQNSPIFIDFSYISASEILLNTKYYTLGTTYETSVPQQAEYQSLGVQIIESTQGDYFEIYGVYDGTNELLDNFVSDLEAKGKKIEIKYEVTLYEEGIQSGYPQTILVTENFSQKIIFRPVIRYSNTTASIDVTMYINDLVNNSQIERFTSIGLTKNIFKYGKILSKINIDSNVIKPKIYKAAPENIIVSGLTSSSNTESIITKVPYPVLYDKHNLLVNSTNSINNEYKSNGLLNILMTPFDNIIKFHLAKSIDSKTNEPIPYDLSEILNNATIKLAFKSDGKILEKNYYSESNENDFKNGIVIFKILENEISIIKEMFNKGFKSFYLTLQSSYSKNMLYSGKYDFIENTKFVDLSSLEKTGNTYLTEETSEMYKKQIDSLNKTYNQTIDQLNNSIKKLEVDKQVSNNSQFDKSTIPYVLPNDAIKNNKNYYNVLLYVKREISISTFDDKLKNLGIQSWIYYDYVYYFTALNINIIAEIEKEKTFLRKIVKIDIYNGQKPAEKVTKTITDKVTTILNNKIKLNQLATNKNLKTIKVFGKTTYLDSRTGKIVSTPLKNLIY